MKRIKVFVFNIISGNYFHKRYGVIRRNGHRPARDRKVESGEVESKLLKVTLLTVVQSKLLLNCIMKWTLSWVFVVLMFHECRSAHILVLTVFGSKSHKIALMPIVKELAGRNHSITFVTPYKSQEVVQGVREINTGNLFKLSQSSQSKSSDFEMNWFELNQYNPLALQYDMMKAIVPIFGPVFNGLMNDPEFDKVLKDRQVDLVIVDDSYHDFCLPIIEHLGAPFILHSASTGYPWTWNAMGASQELASVPNRFSPYDNEMTFRQRLYNAVAGMFVTYVRTSLLIPATDAIVKERFPNARSISAIEKDASLFFISSKVATYWPRQLPPTVIPLGPLHVRPAQPLPQVDIGLVNITLYLHSGMELNL